MQICYLLLNSSIYTNEENLTSIEIQDLPFCYLYHKAITYKNQSLTRVSGRSNQAIYADEYELLLSDKSNAGAISI